MDFDPNDLSPARVYQHLIQLITPRPIAWVSTVSPDGVSNLAPFSFFSGVTSNPPSVVFSPVNRRDGSPKDTLRNIRDTGEFVVNLATYPLRDLMNASSAELDYGVSEFERCGVSAAPSRVVRPPRVAQSPVQLECRLLQLVPVGEGAFAANLVIGRIVWIHVDQELVDSQTGHIDGSRIDTIGRLGGTAYCTTRERFELPRPS